MQLKPILAIGLLAASLSACQSLDQHSADQLARHAFKNSFTTHNQYNFSGEMRLESVPAAQAASAPAATTAITNDAAAVTQAADTAQADADAAVEVADAAVEAANAAAEAASAPKHKRKKNARVQPNIEVAAAATAAPAVDSETTESTSSLPSPTDMAKYSAMRKLIESFSMRMDGAVDIPQGLFEVTPELRFDARNIGAYGRVPMRFDGKQASLLIDPGAAMPFVSWLMDDKTLAAWDGKQAIRFTLPEEFRQKIPLKTIWRALPDALDEGYAAIDPKYFSKLPLNDQARQLGARYLVQMKIPYTEYMKTWPELSQSLIKHMDRAAAEHPEDVTDDYAYAGSRDIISSMGDFGDLTSSGLFKDSEIEYELYLDGRGRMLGIREHMGLPDIIPGAHSSRLTSWMTLNNYGKPVFRFNPPEKDIINGNELLQSWMGKADDTTADGY